MALPGVLCKRLNGELRNVCHLPHTGKGEEIYIHTYLEMGGGRQKSKMKINCDGQGRWHVRFAQ